MKLEDQVVSLELAKKLNELGVKQESYFYWLHSEFTFPLGNTAENWFVHGGTLYNKDPYQDITETVSAFTVAELGEISSLWFRGNDFLSTRFEEGEWGIEIQQMIGVELTPVVFSGDTEADARCLMLIYLLEKGLLNAKYIK